jgi:restriction system protein
MATMWMVRAKGGLLYEEFREKAVAAIGWGRLAEDAIKGASREQLLDTYRRLWPGTKDGAVVASVSQVYRFIHEIKNDDFVVTYSSENRTYLVGQIIGPCEYRPEWIEMNMALVRPVSWFQKEVDRDVLNASSKNSLGSTLTLFKVPNSAQRELLAIAKGATHAPQPTKDELVEAETNDPLHQTEAIAFERIKDQINKLEWDDMQELVAGILRAMGYKTQVSPAGPDRGKDILASPDGFGFQQPRIVVEVKHRDGKMGSSQLRSFLGGRHKDDRGLYVSTGGFTKDALYEAERAVVPLMLWSLDELARALTDNYQNADAKTKQMVPLRYFYMPA